MDNKVLTTPPVCYVTRPGQVHTMNFKWGSFAVTCSRELSGAVQCSGGLVVMHPGAGHTRHNHPGTEEVIYVISGSGEQMIEDEEGVQLRWAVSAGTTIFVPPGRFHSTVNTGSEPMTVFVVYAPGGAEAALRSDPDCRTVAPSA